MKPAPRLRALLAATGIPVCCSFALLGGSSALAAVIYSESFDYGNTTKAINGTAGWTSASTLTKYDHDGGLDHASMSGEKGGSLWLDHTDTRFATDSLPTPDWSLSNLPNGGEIWLAALFQYVPATGSDHYLTLDGGSVSDLGFRITSAGVVQVLASNNGGNAATHSTPLTGTTAGTYLMLLRATKGAGTSPTESTIDFWFNPSNTSNVASLGTPTWTTGADSKFGRDTEYFSNFTAAPSEQGRIDEIRLATNLSEVIAIPEPRAPLLGGLGMLILLRRRRS